MAVPIPSSGSALPSATSGFFPAGKAKTVRDWPTVAAYSACTLWNTAQRLRE